MNYRRRSSLVDFNASDHFVYGDRGTHLLQPAFEGIFCDALSYWFRHEYREFSVSVLSKRGMGVEEQVKLALT
jgi:hypothetical protein